MPDSSVSLDTDWHSYFQDVLTDTLKGTTKPPDPALGQYVLGLLTDSALGDSPVEHATGAPLAVQLADAWHSARAVRFERLRKLGDGVLLLGGLYQPHLVRSGLDDGYVTGIGTRAYRLAAAAMGGPSVLELGSPQSSQPPVDILAELAASFGHLMLFLRDVADTMAVRAMRTSKDMVQLLERWLTSRSDHLGRMLRAEGIALGALA